MGDEAPVTTADVAAATSLRRSVVRLARRLRAARPYGTMPRVKLAVLGHLQARGALTAGALAEVEQTQPQSLTRVLAELEQDGLITRTADPADRRRAVLRATPAGLGALQRDMQETDATLAAAMTATLSPTERDLLRLAAGLMDRLAGWSPSDAVPPAPQAGDQVARAGPRARRAKRSVAATSASDIPGWPAE